MRVVRAAVIDPDLQFRTEFFNIFNRVQFYWRIDWLTGPPTSNEWQARSIVSAPGALPQFGDDLPVSAAGLCLQRIAPDGETRTRDWTADIAGGKLPTVLDGVGVMVNGKPAYIGYISPKQINILTPADATTGPVQIQTTNNGLTSGTVTATMQATSPAFFLFAGGKYIAARHADGTPVGPTTLFPNSSTPAKAGETISLYGTGFGSTTPEAPDGQVAAAAVPLASQPTVMVGGTVAQVMFAGLSAGSAGLYQINVTIPSGAASGDVPVVAQIGALSTQSGAMVAVQ